MSNAKTIKTKLFRNTYITGKIVHKNKEIIITKIWVVVTSRSEGESCDWEEHKQVCLGVQAISISCP